MGMWKEFKEFAFKGNVIDMAVGVVIGSAFGKIVTSLVNDIVMPFFGFLTSGSEIKDMKLMLGGEEGTAILYGSFIQNIIDFVLIAVSVFIFVKLMSVARTRFEKKAEEPAPAPAEPEISSTDKLLIEIRDLLSKDN